MIQNSKKNKLNNNQAFTLIETLVAVGLFSLVVTISVSTLMSILNANTKAQNIKTAVNSVNFAVETISNGLVTSKISTISCLNGNGEQESCADDGNPGISFSSDGQDVSYMIYYSDKEDGGLIMKKGTLNNINNAATNFLIPKDNITINNHKNIFYAAQGGGRVEIVLTITVGDKKGNTLTDLNIQTGIQALGFNN